MNSRKYCLKTLHRQTTVYRCIKGSGMVHASRRARSNGWISTAGPIACHMLFLGHPRVRRATRRRDHDLRVPARSRQRLRRHRRCVCARECRALCSSAFSTSFPARAHPAPTNTYSPTGVESFDHTPHVSTRQHVHDPPESHQSSVTCPTSPNTDLDVTEGAGSILMAVVRSRFIRTDGRVGLTSEDADAAIAILRDPSG